MKLRLSKMRKGMAGKISFIESNLDSAPILVRLMELGFIEGVRVELVREAPFTRDPIAVRVKGSLIALRREEGASIEVDVEGYQ